MIHVMRISLTKLSHLFALIVLAWIASPLAPALADDSIVPEPAASADSLVESIGVATHWGFRNSIYGTKWDQLRPLIGELGVRNVRDGWDPRLEDLRKMYGIRAILVSEPDVPWDQAVARWIEKLDCITAIEGSNEVNGGWAKMRLSYQGKTWPEGPRLFQDELYRRVKETPALKDVPVINLSLAYRGAGVNLAPLRSFDYINAHSYANGQMPSLSLDFQDPYSLIGRGGTFAPMMASESGYHTCLGSSKVIAGSQAGISHEAHRKYIPRHIAEYFNAGMKWTVIYEFAAGRANKAEDEDPEAAFGLLMPDGTPKPAYHALKTLIALLGESKWDAAKGNWIRPMAGPTHSLAFALRGAPASVHHTLLQRSDGSFQLLLWNEVSSFDIKTKKDINHAPVPVTLVLQDLAESIAAIGLGSDASLAKQVKSTKQIDLLVPDEVIVVDIKLAPLPMTTRIDPPQNPIVKTGPTAVEIAWAAAPGIDAYWISLNQRNLGRAVIGSDGQARFNMKRLLPAMTYGFDIVAAAHDGGVSPATRVSATTVDAFPDLVVQSFEVSPESPKEGDELTFSAVVENRGTVPVEDGVLIGIKFRVDGKTVCWNDVLRDGLVPGKRVELHPNGGPNDKLTWTLTRGTHHITALVDDVSRIAESNELNNAITVKVGTGTGPDLVVKNVKPKPSEQGKPSEFEVVIANQGTEAVGKDLAISITLSAIDTAIPLSIGYVLSRDGIAPGSTLTLPVTSVVDLSAEPHRIRAIVDDVDRVPELDETNNRTDFDVELPTGKP